MILQGSCWLVTEGTDAIPLNPGDVVFVPHPRVYVLADDPATPAIDFDPVASDESPVDEVEIPGHGAVTETLCAAYYFDRDRVHPVLDELPPVLHLPSAPGRHAALRGAIELLGTELAAPRPGGAVIVPALVDTLLVLILREWFDEHPATGWATSLNDPAILSALRAIHRRPARPWTVENLAREAGLSRAAFAAKFKTTTTMPPLTYLTWWRMTLAARLLRTTGEPLRTISARVGYASEFAFAKAFKREFATSPRQYRDRRSADRH
ncbi:AraC family transcriptional regulator [Amycolatopsis sp. CA-230715]|uniref:AraC family transcriptional regulator n=1 Tax=Amycolatopsis sp. CA-230715 TaxID=2745196 RepID=UPI001C0315ED|nr:AraC family transcriptional regulator [Amycolatopsis sp. CA-230715]